MNKQWVIGDIHGCLFTLRSLIETKIKPSKTDEIIFLGDYIDRGPDSKGVIDYLISLEESGYAVSFLKGNHEDYLLAAYEAKDVKTGFLFWKKQSPLVQEWLYHGGKEAMKSFNAEHIGEIDIKYINWLKSLKTHIITDKYVIVHAGLNFKIEDPFVDERAMVWTRDYEIIPEKIGNRKIIHGHVPVGLDFIRESISSDKYQFLDLDNGCIYKNNPGMGSLIGFETNSRAFFCQPNIDVF